MLALLRTALLITGMILFCAAGASARIISANLVLAPPVDSHAKVQLSVTMDPVRKISFPDTYAGLSELGNRIEELEAFDTAGKAIPVRRLAPGQFETDADAVRLQYSVDVNPRPEPSDSAHVSWLSFTRGVLALSDLLPVDSRDRKSNVDVQFRLPSEWTVRAAEGQKTPEQFVVNDVDRAVFVVGSRLRAAQKTASGMIVELVTDGEWAFTDAEALDLAISIVAAHRDVFGKMPAARALVVLLPFPQTVAAHRWAAETRGTTVTLLMGKQPSKVAALAQLSTPLTHELFHLWVPNALMLEGDYGWFYEGFTVYQAARTAVDLGLLTFPEFLTAIARAYDGIGTQSNSMSLIEASSRRWTTGLAAVYSKSMVVAFLLDLKMRQRGSKKSLNVAYRKLLEKHAADGAEATDGNEAAARALSVDDASAEFIRKFVQSAVTINLATELAPFGLNVETFGLRTRISVNDKLNKGQRDLLRDLGYNDVARSPRR